MTKREDRRRARRSSPDAPQGYVPILTVFAGLIALIVVAASGFIDQEPTTTRSDPEWSIAGHRTSLAEAGRTAPTTTYIRGAGSTARFVTTTTPITTTSSTTTTPPKGPAFLIRQNQVTIDPDKGFVLLTLYSQWPRPVGFLVTGVPDGYKVAPLIGSAKVGAPATIIVQLTDPAARPGTLELAGENGTMVTVRLSVGARAPSVDAITTTPSPPRCHRSTLLVASVSGTDVESVTFQRSDNDDSDGPPVAMMPSGTGNWSTYLAGAPAGTLLTGTVIATDAQGRSATRVFSVAVAGGAECTN